MVWSAPSGYATSMAAVMLTVVGAEMEAETLCGLLRANDISCSVRRTDVSAGMERTVAASR